ncbi:hypothetical protein BG003_009021 [Podila horticola]|nr:hypothetical protein BG003_009021 [Podila horticola]
MKLFAITTLLTAFTTLIQAGPVCRSTTLRVRYPMKPNSPPGSVRIDWIVNSGYEDTMYLDSFPYKKVCSYDGYWCVWGDFKSPDGYPRFNLIYRNMAKFYPSVHVWLARDDQWEEIEYWDCI